MCAMASRTLLVNPKEEQKQAYLIAFNAMDILAQNLKVGQPISGAYDKAKEVIMQKKESL